MTSKNLFRILSLVGQVKSYSWNKVMELVELLNLDKISVESQVWNDNWKQNNPDYYPLNLKDIKIWSTYDGTCINLRYYMSDGKLKCEAKIYEGEILNGYPTKLRFTAILILNNSFIKSLSELLEYEFKEFAGNEYKRHLEDERNK